MFNINNDFSNNRSVDWKCVKIPQPRPISNELKLSWNQFAHFTSSKQFQKIYICIKYCKVIADFQGVGGLKFQFVMESIFLVFFYFGRGGGYFLRKKIQPTLENFLSTKVKKKRLNYQELVKSCSWSLASHPCVEATVQGYRQQCLFFLFFLAHVSGPIKNINGWVNR